MSLSLCCGVALLCSSFAGSSDSLVIAVRGKPADCAVVVPAGAGPCLRYAADELTNYVFRSTGVSMPLVVTDGGAPVPSGRRAIALSVGKTSPLHPGSDGFRISVTNECLVVSSPTERGVLFGAYEMLERFAGIEWLASDCEVVPRNLVLAVPGDLDEVHEPAFSVREVYWCDPRRNPEFGARIRLNSYQWNVSIDAKFGGNENHFDNVLDMAHTFYKIVPPEKHFADHPEYFSLVNGERKKRAAQLCLSNPDVLRIAIEFVRKRMRENPSVRFFGVSQMDWAGNCQCERCLAIDKEEGSPSGAVVRFVNAIAEAVEPEFPDRIIEFLAYTYAVNPPKKTRVRKNVMPCLCTMDCEFARPFGVSRFPFNVRFQRQIEGWSSMSDRMMVWDYVINYWHLPHYFPNVYTLQENARFFRDHNVKWLYEEGARCKGAYFAELKTWLLGKLLWDPDQPLGPLLDRFCSGYYGKGATYVRQFIEFAEARMRSSGRTLELFADTRDLPFDEKDLSYSEELWQKAAEAVKDEGDAVRRHVRQGLFWTDYTLFFSEPGRYYVSRDMQRRVRNRTAARARRILAALNDFDFKMGHDTIARQELEMAARLMPEKMKKSDATVVRLAEIYVHWTLGKLVADKTADGGWSLQVDKKNFRRSALVHGRDFVYDANARYKVKLHARIVRKADAPDGEAFRFGVGKKDATRQPLAIATLAA